LPPASLMPRRSYRGSFCPPNDNATYKDLLLFEERLKINAASLQRRKSRYQLFLLQLLLVIAFLLSEVLLSPSISLLAIPYKFILQRLFPPSESEITLHPYVASGLLFVSVTTLVLFFASGMYSEKIGYANKYVPHANRALRSFNMFLNVRRPPLKFYWNPLSFFFPRPTEPSRPPPSSSLTNRARSTSTTRPIQPIPPAANPRGELIFSSRIDKNFRDSYERYRSAFERKRELKEYIERHKKWYGNLLFWESAPTPAPPNTVPTRPCSARGAGSRSGTPPTTGGGIVMKQRDRGGSPIRREDNTVREGVVVDMRTGVLG